MVLEVHSLFRCMNAKWMFYEIWIEFLQCNVWKFGILTLHDYFNFEKRQPYVHVYSISTIIRIARVAVSTYRVPDQAKKLQTQWNVYFKHPKMTMNFEKSDLSLWWGNFTIPRSSLGIFFLKFGICSVLGPGAYRHITNIPYRQIVWQTPTGLIICPRTLHMPIFKKKFLRELLVELWNCLSVAI